jgi:hypothetical protein
MAVVFVTVAFSEPRERELAGVWGNIDAEIKWHDEKWESSERPLINCRCIGGRDGVFDGAEKSRDFIEANNETRDGE